MVGSPYPGMDDEAGNVYVGRNEDEVRKENTSVPTLPCVRTKTFSTPGSLCAVDLLYPWLAGKYRRTAPVHPTSVMVSGFDIIFFWIAR